MSSPVLLYDGLCAFCDGTVQFVLAHDPGGAMRFAPLDGAYARALLARHREVSGIDSLIYVDGERVLTRSDAAIALGRYLGGVAGFLARVCAIAPRFLRDAAYQLFALTRYRVWGKRQVCRVPGVEERGRFI